MTYLISHKTTYKYKHPVSIGNHLAYLTPRSQPGQVCDWNELHIKPTPAMCSRRTDYFGNAVNVFTIQDPHEKLEIEARSRVMLDGQVSGLPLHSPPWEEVARSVPADSSPAGIEAYQFVFESPRIKTSPEFGEYASQSFAPRLPLAEALLDLTARIHKDFRFDSKATTVRTPTEEVFRRRRGVCQDFAHLQIACLRSLNLPARYVSGYLRTYRRPEDQHLTGADASHAWVSVYCPDAGWLDVDPTNNVVPSQSHVTLAWGRDYGDVSPVRGVIVGGRDHTLEVAVEMRALE